MKTTNQFMTGLLTLAVSLLTAFTLIPAEAWNESATIWQFGALVVSSIAAIYLPLTKGGWHSILKTGSAALLAGIGALIPLLNGTFGPLQWALLGVAVLNAVAIELGVAVRISDARHAVVDPAENTAAAKETDPAATMIAIEQVASEHRAQTKLGT